MLRLASKKSTGTVYRLSNMFAIGHQYRRAQSQQQLRSFSEVFQPYSEQYYSTGEQVLATIIRDEPKDIEYALRNELKVDCVLYETGETPLMVAAANNCCKVIRLLLKLGASINMQDNLGQTALFKASQNDHKDAVRILLEANAQKDVLNYEQMTARDVTLDNEIDNMLH